MPTPASPSTTPPTLPTAATTPVAPEVPVAPARTPPLPPDAYPVAEPRATVVARADATLSPDMVHLRQDGAVKYNTFSSRAGYPRGGANLRTHLHVEAWVRNVTFAKHVWVDVHVYTHDGTLAHQETLPLAYTRPAGDGGDVFALDAALFQGPIATPGSVTLRPDARIVEYRLYCQLEGQVYTDGVLHACYLKPDVASG
jgi:hypothetical protein